MTTKCSLDANWCDRLPALETEPIQPNELSRIDQLAGSCADSLFKLDIRRFAVRLLHKRKARNVGATPAIHRFVANLAYSIASLPERQLGYNHFIDRMAMWTLIGCHGRTMRLF